MENILSFGLEKKGDVFFCGVWNHFPIQAVAGVLHFGQRGICSQTPPTAASHMCLLSHLDKY